MYEPNNMIEYKWTELYIEIDKSIFIVGYDDALFSVINGTSRQEINNIAEDLRRHS